MLAKKVCARLLVLMLLTLCLGLSGCQSGNREEETREDRPDAEQPAWTNVLIYLIDTLRADHLGCYGYDKVVSPNIDRLAGQGVVFERTYAQAPWTKSSVASILTSNYPTTHGALAKFDGVINPGAVTLAEALKERGYATAGFVANPLVGKNFGFGQGFDEYRLIRNPIMRATSTSATAGEGQSPKRRKARGEKIHALAEHLNEVVFPWLDQHASEPFFLYVHSIDPHDPYYPPAPFDQIDPSYDGWITGSSKQMEDLVRKGTRLKPEDLRHLLNLYDGEIAYNDHHVGKLIEKLEALDILDETLIVITSDHGEEFYEHGSYRHGRNLYEHMIRVPLIMACPGLVPPGERRGALVQTIDIMPTVLEILGFDIPEPAQGKSLVPVMNGRSRRINDYAYSERSDLRGENPDRVLLGVMTDRWKLITYPGGQHHLFNPHGHVEQLFDLEKDPGEQMDQAEARTELVDKFEKALDKWLVSLYSRTFVEQAEEPEIDEETYEQIKSLGYVN